MAPRATTHDTPDVEILARAQAVQHLPGCPVQATDDLELASRVERYTITPPRMNEAQPDSGRITTATHCVECGAITYSGVTTS